MLLLLPPHPPSSAQALHALHALQPSELDARLNTIVELMQSTFQVDYAALSLMDADYQARATWCGEMGGWHAAAWCTRRTKPVATRRQSPASVALPS